jgi:hypothetical protein
MLVIDESQKMTTQFIVVSRLHVANGIAVAEIKKTIHRNDDKRWSSVSYQMPSVNLG